MLQRPENHIDDIEMIPNDKDISIHLEGQAQLSIYKGEELLVNTPMENTYTYTVENQVYGMQKNHSFTGLYWKEQERLSH